MDQMNGFYVTSYRTYRAFENENKFAKEEPQMFGMSVLKMQMVLFPCLYALRHTHGGWRFLWGFWDSMRREQLRLKLSACATGA